ncbi:MAG: MoaD/ThiS family protein [archaeon]
MKLIIQRDKDEEFREINTDSKTINELLEEIGINPVTHVVSLNGEVAVEDEELKERDKLKIQRVVSGG